MLEAQQTGVPAVSEQRNEYLLHSSTNINEFKRL